MKNRKLLEEELGKYLRLRRKALDLKQATVAEKARLSDTYLSQIENGISSPSFITLLKLVEPLKIDLVDLYKQFKPLIDQIKEKAE
ncbi:helix-turn-helix domain-containing protein [Paraliobacillus sediminis]|uniref:helix-turn-helix domain-containing protein n=1 Tax=Paraliobacillus sediminis TaxID=1885916 RepID=UPI0013C2A674|nr:helix-turn-helix transcriptional regulator [Paraliobacillus sediminis]